MKKIISLFQRNYDGDRRVRDEIVPGAEWVTAGEGRATRKWDGTSCLVRDGVLYKRYDAKHGKTPPPDFMPAQEPDPTTGHWPGWVPVGTSPADKWHREVVAPDSPANCGFLDGTYELIGPKVQGNPYHLDSHLLVPHAFEGFDPEPPRDFDGLKAWLAEHAEEGIVWHHPDGRMVKIKARDFGIAWPRKG